MTLEVYCWIDSFFWGVSMVFQLPSQRFSCVFQQIFREIDSITRMMINEEYRQMNSHSMLFMHLLVDISSHQWIVLIKGYIDSIFLDFFKHNDMNATWMKKKMIYDHSLFSIRNKSFVFLGGKMTVKDNSFTAFHFSWYTLSMICLCSILFSILLFKNLRYFSSTSLSLSLMYQVDKRIHKLILTQVVRKNYWMKQEETTCKV